MDRCVDGARARVRYGTVPAEGTLLQQTFPSHVWLLERSTAPSTRPQPAKQRLHYAAPRDKVCLATVTDDAGCRVHFADRGRASPDPELGRPPSTPNGTVPSRQP